MVGRVRGMTILYYSFMRPEINVLQLKGRLKLRNLNFEFDLNLIKIKFEFMLLGYVTNGVRPIVWMGSCSSDETQT